MGDTETKVAGIGTVVIYGVNPTTGSAVKINLFQTRYSPNFHSNLISYGLMMKGGLLMNLRANYIEIIDGYRQIYKIYYDQKLSWLTQIRGFIT